MRITDEEYNAFLDASAKACGIEDGIARATLDDVIARVEATWGDCDPRLVPLLRLKAIGTSFRIPSREDEVVLRRAMAIKITDPAASPEDVAAVIAETGGFLAIGAGDTADALSLLEDALRRFRACARPLAIAHTVSTIAGVYLEYLVDPVSALPFATEAFELYASETDSPHYANAAHRLGRSLVDVGRASEAVVILTTALERYEGRSTPLRENGLRSSLEDLLHTALSRERNGARAPASEAIEALRAFVRSLRARGREVVELVGIDGWLRGLVNRWSGVLVRRTEILLSLAMGDPYAIADWAAVWDASTLHAALAASSFDDKRAASVLETLEAITRMIDDFVESIATLRPRPALFRALALIAGQTADFEQAIVRWSSERAEPSPG